MFRDISAQLNCTHKLFVATTLPAVRCDRDYIKISVVTITWFFDQSANRGDFNNKLSRSWFLLSMRYCFSQIECDMNRCVVKKTNIAQGLKSLFRTNRTALNFVLHISET